MILYTAPWCNPCAKLKQWLSATGNGEGVEIVEKETAADFPDYIKILPTLDVDGTLFVGNEDIRPFLSEVSDLELDL